MPASLGLKELALRPIESLSRIIERRAAGVPRISANVERFRAEVPRSATSHWTRRVLVETLTVLSWVVPLGPASESELPIDSDLKPFFQIPRLVPEVDDVP